MTANAMSADTFAHFLDALRRFVRERLVPAEKEVVANDAIPAELLTQMREIGLFGLTVPASYGGLGLAISETVEAIMELSWAAPAFRSAVTINTGIGSLAIASEGTERQKTEWLPRLARGDIAAFALTEPDSGSDAAALRCRAIRQGDSYVLNGTKRYITNAPLASVIIVLARTNVQSLPGNAHVTAFLAPADTPGLTIGKPDKKMGQRGSLTADVIMQDVRVPASAMLGGAEGRGFKLAMRALDRGRLSVAAGAIGHARRILHEATGYAIQRRAFGEPIANYQLIQAMLADSKCEIYAAECMLRDAARRADAGERISAEASCCKMFASEMVGRVADRGVQIFGGAGYMQEYDMERFFRDARVYRIYEGTTQIQQLLIAKSVLRSFQSGLT
jgi:acyl-CoA dehydrogenase